MPGTQRSARVELGALMDDLRSPALHATLGEPTAAGAWRAGREPIPIAAPAADVARVVDARVHARVGDGARQRNEDRREDAVSFGDAPVAASANTSENQNALACVACPRESSSR